MDHHDSFVIILSPMIPIELQETSVRRGLENPGAEDISDDDRTSCMRRQFLCMYNGRISSLVVESIAALFVSSPKTR